MSKKSKSSNSTPVIPPFPTVWEESSEAPDISQPPEDAAVVENTQADETLPLNDTETISPDLDYTDNDSTEDDGDSLQEESLLDTVPSSWEINTSGATPVALFMNDEDNVLATVPLDEGFLSEFVPVVNEFYIVPEEEAPTWVIRIPDTLDPNPVFSLMRKGKVIGSVPLMEDDLKDILPLLNGFYKKPLEKKVPRSQRFWNWVTNHKVLSVFAALFVLPFAAAVLWGIIVQIQVSFF